MGLINALFGRKKQKNPDETQSLEHSEAQATSQALEGTASSSPPPTTPSQASEPPDEVLTNAAEKKLEDTEKKEAGTNPAADENPENSEDPATQSPPPTTPSQASEPPDEVLTEAAQQKLAETEKHSNTDTAAQTQSAVSGDPLDEEEIESMKNRIVDQIRTCYDPEIPVNIYELGLIYNIEVNPDTKHVDVDMTLTSPMCPVAGTLPLEVEEKVRAAEGVASAKVDVVWEPQWTPEKMSETARVELGFDL